MNVEQNSESKIPYLIIDPAKLQADTLAHLAREFVLREQGNDFSDNCDVDVATQRALHLIKDGTLLITFDPFTESVGVMHHLDPAVKEIKS